MYRMRLFIVLRAGTVCFYKHTFQDDIYVVYVILLI